MRARIDDILANATGQEVARIHRDTDRDFVMSAEEAKEYGLVDTVLASRKKGLVPASSASVAQGWWAGCGVAT